MFKELTIDDKKVFDRYLKTAGKQNSESCFTTLFLWKHQLNYKYAIINDMLCIQAQYGNYPSFFYMPYGDGDIKTTLEALWEYSHKNGGKMRIRPVLFEDKKLLERLFPNKFHFTELRYAYDYVYFVNELISLSGKKYHQKRNHFNKFIEDNEGNYSFETTVDVEKCRSIMNGFLDRQEGDTSGERTAMKHLFDNYEALDVTGSVIKLSDKIIAMSFAEIIKDDTVLIHVEKADKNVRGAYNAINKKFLENCYSDKTYVNREEDMGIEGLRKAKSSYNPVYLIEKFEAVEL